MSPIEFTIWLKGFVKAANTYNITPKQWENICEELDKVEVDKDKKWTRYTLDHSNWSVSLSNLGLTTDTTYGRPEDSITPTND